MNQHQTRPALLPRLILAALPLFLLLPARQAEACTSYLITPGASADGSSMITYAADSHELYGELYFRPAGTHPPGATLEVVEWDTGKKLGRIPQVRRTYQVVGNLNEHQLAISETTFGGRKELHDPEGKIDYGSLIYITLQRAKTAREAISVMAALTEAHGYCSEGESFSLADPQEAWIMEMVGKGPKGHGAVWVARKIPDGYISAHANQARIRRFPQNDPDSCLYAKDVISFARQQGWFSGKDEEFSFADAYAPMDYEAARFCEARVWQMFRRAAPEVKLAADFVTGKGVQKLPLWIKPATKLTVQAVAELMRDHFEGTALDLGRGFGAGPYALPYRWRPLTWEVEGKKYLNDRSVSTQQTGFSFVSQSRAALPGAIGGVLWFGVDDTYSTVYVPMYAGIRSAPRSFAVGTANFNTFSWESAFWVFNFVSNFAYSRYQDMIKDIRQVQKELEDGFFAAQAQVEQKALTLHRRSPTRARAYLSAYSASQAQKTVERWRKLGEELLVKYLDGNVRDAKGKITHPGYSKSWYKRIVQEDGERYQVRAIGSPAVKAKAKVLPRIPAAKRPQKAPQAPRP